MSAGSYCKLAPSQAVSGEHNLGRRSNRPLRISCACTAARRHPMLTRSLHSTRGLDYRRHNPTRPRRALPVQEQTLCPGGNPISPVPTQGIRLGYAAGHLRSRSAQHVPQHRSSIYSLNRELVTSFRSSRYRATIRGGAKESGGCDPSGCAWRSVIAASTSFQDPAEIHPLGNCGELVCDGNGLA